MFDVVEITRDVIARAIEAVTGHALRAADALQLACALVAVDQKKDVADFFFVSADTELNAAARLEGLAVIDPTDPS